MPSFKLEGDDTPEPQGEAPPGGAQSGASKPADEFSYFLEDESSAKPKPAPPPPAKPATPAPPGSPAQAARPGGTTPASRPAPPPSTARPAAPPSNTDATKALPDLMRPAQRRPGGPPADPSQPAHLNVPAAHAVTPHVTEPDAAAIAQSATPSDDLSSGIQEFGARIARILDAGDDVFTWVARVAVLVVGFSLAVLLAGLFLGNAANIAQNPKGADLANFLVLATKGLTLGTLALSISMLLLTYDDNRMGAIVAGIGLLFHFGGPLGLRALLGPTNPLLGALAIQFFNIGRILLVIGMFKAVIDVGIWLFNLPNQIKSKQSSAGAVGFGNPVESKQAKLARQANMFSPCWKLPFCREPIRVLCPAFLAKKTCWKFGRGCYCDTEMVGRIVRNEPLEVIKAANTMQSKQAPPCGRCYIFLEHQTHKFRMISPLVLPTTILFMFGIWPLYNRLFLGFTSGYTKLFSSLSFSTASFTPDAIKASAEGQAQAAAGTLSPQEIAQVSSYMLGALLGFFLLIYLSKFVEWAIFKAKW
ncbi:hypothetical protein IAD21_05886 [Abditibacteriota bacterium]|nr:hypothetical protein IAD21_05886 [Abditibacteriota bacterium]